METVRIEEVIEAINKNTNLVTNFKTELGKSLIDYVQVNREVDLTNFLNNFNSLQTERSSRIHPIETYEYDSKRNVLIVNENYLAKKDTNVSNLYMQMVLDLIVSSQKKGLQESGFSAIYKGVRESIANSMCGWESKENFNSDEYIYANLLGRIIGIDELVSIFINNDAEKMNALLSSKELKEINELAEYNKVRNEHQPQFSELYKIQFKILEYCEKNNLEIDDIILNMALSSKIFSEPNKYIQLDNLRKISEDYKKTEKIEERKIS